MNEFDLIARYFAPLAEGFPGAVGLADDAALLTPPAGSEIVATTDTLNEGVHFIGDEPPGELARKLLRVNLSDLAAKGAKPWCYLLNLALPASCNEGWIAAFAQGLAQDQQRYGIVLAGGDTTATRTGISLSLTAFGLVKPGRILRRKGAMPGDLLYVTGTIGEGALGLKVAQGASLVSAADDAGFLRAYRLPDPPVESAVELAALAHAGMDISDGLAADIAHLCNASDVGAEINAADVPLSEAARRWLAQPPHRLEELLGGGDDYQLLLAIPPEREEDADRLATSWCMRLTCIGVITSHSKAVEFRDAEGKLLQIPSGGWQHRFGDA